MTVEADYNILTYEGNGVTTEFAVPFKFFDEEVAVYKNKTYETYAKDVDYEIIATTYGGKIIFKKAPLKGESITIVRSVPLNQLVTFIEGEAFPARDYEYSLDRIVMALQEMWANLEKVAIPPAEVSLKDFISNYYNKQDVDAKLNDYYTKEDVDKKVEKLGGGTVTKFVISRPSQWVPSGLGGEDYPMQFSTTFPNDNYKAGLVQFMFAPAASGYFSSYSHFEVDDDNNCTVTVFGKDLTDYPYGTINFNLVLFK